ncbi:DUF1484 family protein [Pseudogulbenkiania subflava]|uniref:DUF1484 domain-containing protein n=1 Tax=Pseudogulbenkiania subflava DSM 22618 TaxID=1123014 RepID=A0A1Y6C1K3_9NEIS|nr:DUF1484 family protein [Pseudogulbenkiania subflava]SMF31545.1 Protein of unknown function [Pseudogulbenkiania subflava DSM 22618]
MSATIPPLALNDGTLAVAQLQDTLRQLRQLCSTHPELSAVEALLARLETNGHDIDTILCAGLQELHAVHDGLSTALMLLDHAGETALSGNGLYSLLQPLNQRFQQALMRVNDLI